MDSTDKLIALANSESRNNHDREWWLNFLTDEECFDDVRKVHDWRNYVPSEVVEVWNYLPLDARLIAFAMAENRARNEEWD